MAKRYDCSYAVVTGANGGVGRELARQLLKEVNVIALCRRPLEMERLAKELNGVTPFKLYPFEFDLEVDLPQFGLRFEQFLAYQGIRKNDIGILCSNAGKGSFCRFEATSATEKLNFMRLNLDAHMTLADYFSKLFLERKAKKRGAIIFTGSLAGAIPVPNFSLYHVAKTALSNMGNAMFAELGPQGIDVLTLIPYLISNTNFFEAKEMTPLKRFQKYVDIMRNSSLASVSPKQIADKAFSRIGKISQAHVGWQTSLGLALNFMGRNFLGYFFSFFQFGK